MRARKCLMPKTVASICFEQAITISSGSKWSGIGKDYVPISKERTQFLPWLPDATIHGTELLWRSGRSCRLPEKDDSALKIRNSVLVELALIAVVYTVGLLVWNSRTELGLWTWYELPGGRWNLTPAGYWYVFVSLPLFQFILLRWRFHRLLRLRRSCAAVNVQPSDGPGKKEGAGGLWFVGSAIRRKLRSKMGAGVTPFRRTARYGRYTVPADLGNSYQVIREMRIVPFGPKISGV
jgi:hypothetical protein